MTLEECVAYLERAAPALDIPAEHVAFMAALTREKGRTLGEGRFTPEFRRERRTILWRFWFHPAGPGNPRIYQMMAAWVSGRPKD